MSRVIEFTKMHGLGNDYIYVDAHRFPLVQPERWAVEWSRQHTGVGSDGLILVGRSAEADFSMRIFNADGTEAMMCGNGARCVGKFVRDHHLTDKTDITLATLSGIKRISLQLDGDEVTGATVDMGTPLLSNTEQVATADGTLHDQTLCVGDSTFAKATYVCMGNPHVVIFTPDVDCVERVGEALEHHPLFPQRANIEMATLLPDGTLRMRVWERGSGITQACGTGACATAVAAHLCSLTGREAVVRMDGGDLHIRWGEDNHIYMTGPAVTTFEGRITIE